MATDLNVSDGVKVARKLLMTYVVVSDSTTPEWEIVGRGVEESAIELNPEAETVTDILGITETSITKWEATQTFEPNTVRGGSKLNMKLHQIWQDKTPEKLTQFKVLLVYAYLGTSNNFEAEMHKNCTVNPTSIGGSAYVDMPIEITYSNDITKGTVSMSDGVPTFTANS